MRNANFLQLVRKKGKLTALQESLRVMRNFRKRKKKQKTPTTDLNIFLSKKFFQREVIMSLQNYNNGNKFNQNRFKVKIGLIIRSSK